MFFLLPLFVGALAGGLLGLCAGWLARGREEVVVEKVVTQAVGRLSQGIDDATLRREQATEFLAQLQQLTSGVSAKIDAHSRTVGDINEELTGTPAQTDAVVAAIARLVESNTAMQSQLQVAQMQLKEQASLLEARQEEARTDPLTRLRNRRAFDHELAHRIEQCSLQRTTLSLLMLDVDHFKQCNDNYGHPAGDEVLRLVGRLLAEKAAEIPGAFAARYGGEELALLFSGQSLQSAAELGDEVRRLIEQATIHYAGRSLSVTVSMGAAERIAGEGPAEFIARTDAALYAAKKAGRNCLHLHERGETRAFEPENLAAGPQAPATEQFSKTDDRVLAKSITRRIAEWRRGGEKLSLIVARLDNLAALDAQGVNRAIQQGCEFFKSSLREMDEFALLAGEIFGILLPTAQLADAVRIAERMRVTFPHNGLSAEPAADVTLSFGVAEVLPDDDGDSLILRARRALEAARRRGGNAVFVNDGVYSLRAQQVLDLANASLASA